MPAEFNYLLGQGELYTEDAKVSRGHKEKNKPYTFSQAKARLAPQIEKAAAAVAALPAAACPNNEAVAVLTLHPEYMSKSAYPDTLISNAGLRAIGSKQTTVTPARVSNKKKKPKPTQTADIYLAGPRPAFANLSKEIDKWNKDSEAAGDLIKIEGFRVQETDERVKPMRSKSSDPLLEVVLHTGGEQSAANVRRAFVAFLNGLGVDVDLSQAVDLGDLTFIPVRAPKTKLKAIGEFAFLRVAREMPRLRELRPEGTWPRKQLKSFDVTLPRGGVVDPTIRVAVFDGGMPDVASLGRWVDRYDEDVAGEMREFERHGLAVTSAVLFGPLKKNTQAQLPYAKVDHYRVLDEDTAIDRQYELYPVLKRIVTALEREHYDFVNLSIGPDIPIDDDDVHLWTAQLDSLLSKAKGKTLASLAVGNTGRRSAALRLNRIQPPGDAVNALSVGAANSTGPKWNRAPYSSIGHGRCPGIMKPDVVAFGGDTDDPFWVVDFDDPSTSLAIWGTSFASPYALHTAIGIRAALGPAIDALSLKALLIHNCKRSKAHAASGVGWGRIETNIEKIITCSSSTAHVIYRGDLQPKKYLRADIPMPQLLAEGPVYISATICLATEVDADHPAHYTRSGLDIYFRPDKNTVPKDKKNPTAKSFFRSKDGSPEIVLMRDGHKWETVRHRSKRIADPSSLKSPAFDLHYNPRLAGMDTDAATPIPYAMIVSVFAPKVPDLYGRILSKYQKLRPLQPRIRLQTRT